jgi:hypothetical protein
MVLGLALVLALMVGGVATVAFGADSDVVKAGRNKVASLVKVLGDVNGSPADFKGILEHSEGTSFLGSGFHTVVAHATKGSPVDVLLSCPSQTSAGTLRIVNKAADFGDLEEVWVDDGSANPSFDTIGQNQNIDKSVSPNGDHFTIQVSSIFDANRLATIELFTEGFGPSVCKAKAHVIYTFAS